MTSFSCHSRNHNTIWCYSTFANIIHFPQHLPPRHTSRSVTHCPFHWESFGHTIFSSLFSPLPHIFTSSSPFPFFFLIFWKIFHPHLKTLSFPLILLPANLLTHQICFLISPGVLLVLIIIKIFMTDYKIYVLISKLPWVISNLLHSDQFSKRLSILNVSKYFLLHTFSLNPL